jgi:hypothetical protein
MLRNSDAPATERMLARRLSSPDRTPHRSGQALTEPDLANRLTSPV